MTASKRIGLSAAAAVCAAGFVAVVASEGSRVIPKLNPDRMPPLPRQGFIVGTKGGVVLYRLDGHPIGQLPGFTENAPNVTSIESDLGDALASDRDAIFLWGPDGRPYLFDRSARMLRSTTSMRVPLAGEAVLSARRLPVPVYGEHFRLRVLRHGKDVIPPRDPLDLLILRERLVVIKGAVLDLVSGTRWPMNTVLGGQTDGSTCVPGGLHGTMLVAVCTSGMSVKAFLISPHGSRRAIGPHVSTNMFANDAAVSPDGRYLAIQLVEGCELAYAAVVPLGSGSGHVVSGEPLSALRDGRSQPRRWSRLIGWTESGRIIASIFNPFACDSTPAKIATYAFNPSTLQKTRLSPGGKAWGARP